MTEEQYSTRSSMEFKYEIKFGFVKAREWVSSKTETYYHREQAMRRYCELKTKIDEMEAKLTPEQRYTFLDCAQPKCFIHVFWREDGDWNRTITGEMGFFYEATDRLTRPQIMNPSPVITKETSIVTL